ncbi:MAG TPA: peptidase E [Solirubrobacterales bacterium]|nr:peptidase E [Solirubrobacterales bacterium]
MGGHEFSRRQGNEALRDYMLGLVDSDCPWICLLPTASGDPDEQIAAFARSLGERPCNASHLSLFRLEGQRVSVRQHLLRQDLIYVGGGSLLNLLAIWRTQGIDRILKAWERGIVLCGRSAGAMCWFKFGITRSAGNADPRRGLGLLPGTLCVHYDGDPVRRSAFREAVGFGIPAGYGVDDQAGLLFRGTELVEAVSARPGAGAWRVEPADGARSEELPLQMPRWPTPDRRSTSRGRSWPSCATPGRREVPARRSRFGATLRRRRDRRRRRRRPRRTARPPRRARGFRRRG